MDSINIRPVSADRPAPVAPPERSQPQAEQAPAPAERVSLERGERGAEGAPSGFLAGLNEAYRSLPAVGGVTPPPPTPPPIPTGAAAERLVNTAAPRQVGDFSRMHGMSSRELISRLPPEARLEPFRPSQNISEGMKARWTDGRGIQHFFEIHGPDRGPNAGPNASQGDVARYRQNPTPPEGLSNTRRNNFVRENSRYMSSDGRMLPGHVSPNETHVPVQGNPTTPAYQRAAQVGRIAGRGLTAVGAAQSAYNIATAEDRARAVTQEATAWSGAHLLARGGAALCSPAGPLAAGACGLAGGVVGFAGGHVLGGVMYDRATQPAGSYQDRQEPGRGRMLSESTRMEIVRRRARPGIAPMDLDV